MKLGVGILLLVCWVVGTWAGENELPRKEIVEKIQYPIPKVAEIKYPKIVDFKGKVDIQRKDMGPLVPQKEVLLRGQDVQIKTDSKSDLTIAFSPEFKVQFLPDTTAVIPQISWDTGQISDLRLKEGKIRTEGSVESSFFVLTDLVEAKIPPGDFILEYAPKVPRMKVHVKSGVYALRAMNGDESREARPGESTSFTGKIVDDEVEYDLLLKGRKIPKGQLGAVEKTPQEILDIFEPPKKDPKKEAQSKSAAKESEKSRGICEKPWGDFNQCSWVCQNHGKDVKGRGCHSEKGDSCVRRRCNANGLWAEAATVSPLLPQCSGKDNVSVCDY